MLSRMFIGEPEVDYDKLLDFSTAKKRILFFYPSINMLNDFSG